MTQPRDVLYASKLFQEWLGDLKQRALLQTHNQSQAMFRGVLHGLRRHMTTAQVLSFADALPPLPRGIFIEGWRPADPLPLASADAFLREVVDSLAPHVIPPDSIVTDVFAMLAKFSEPSDVQTMREQTPKALQPLWPQA
jgi:uncharacterized protein (DUF2267 family)